ncbi:inner membrane protein PPF-1 [Forsythia ovata]|uniref:Inner membrane protein PPF-1 n=2 Tax=Magnoliopsida TaxID=3398 RepID=A0ABD1RH66_9LAMI
MARTLISSPSFLGIPCPSSFHRRLPPQSRRISTKLKYSLHEIPPIHYLDNSIDFNAIFSRAEGLLYTLADAAVAVDGGTASESATDAAQKSGGWFGFISDAMEVVLKVLKDGLAAVHVPYAYGFAIILLTVLVKVATLPLTKQQVESTLAMQNLQPKIKAIQQRYAGNQERIQLETSRLYKQAGVNPLAGCFPTLATIPVWIGLYQALSNVANEGLLTEGFFWIPSLGGPTTIAARQSGSGISWLFPFVDGHPPLGWHDTAAYLVLPVLLVVSQYVSMEIMKPPQTDDPSQKNTLLVLKFLPFMIGYFSLSVPSGLSIYWFTNNVLSTAQQVWLRKMGGAKPVVTENASGIISAGRAKRSGAQPEGMGDRFRQLKEDENKKKSKALPADEGQTSLATDSEDESNEETKSKDEEVLEEAYASSSTKSVPSGPRRSKRSKRKRTVLELEDVNPNGQQKIQDNGLILLGLVGLKDPCRPSVKTAVEDCQYAWVNVKMITGDNVFTATTIATECGILKLNEEMDDGSVVEGVTFRNYTEEERMEKVDKICVMAISSPLDKLLMVQCLKKKGHVVAVTGDGTNDAPALKEVDIGLSMGIQGTEVAKESSDIVILDDNFASLATVLRWGRCVYNNIQKFIQFQLIVAALTINFAAAEREILTLFLEKYPACTPILRFNGENG